MSPSIFTITKWDPPSGGSFSDLVAPGSTLIIIPILKDQGLLWIDQSGNLCLIRSLLSFVPGKPVEPIARVGVTGIIPTPLQSAKLKYTNCGVEVHLAFDESGEPESGPAGTITAEANPPIQDDLPKGFWRWLRSLFRWFRSLFR